MPLQTTGQISHSDIMAEYNVTPSTEWNLSVDGAPLINFAAASQIAESDFYGKSAAPTEPFDYEILDHHHGLNGKVQDRSPWTAIVSKAGGTSSTASVRTRYTTDENVSTSYVRWEFRRSIPTRTYEYFWGYESFLDFDLVNPAFNVPLEYYDSRIRFTFSNCYCSSDDANNAFVPAGTTNGETGYYNSLGNFVPLFRRYGCTTEFIPTVNKDTEFSFQTVETSDTVADYVANNGGKIRFRQKQYGTSKISGSWRVLQGFQDSLAFLKMELIP